MIKTWSEEAIEKSLCSLLMELLEERFGPLNEQVRRRLAELDQDKLKPLFKALLRAQSLGEIGLEDDAPITGP